MYTKSAKMPWHQAAAEHKFYKGGHLDEHGLV